jgi:hypothetical protein
MRGFEGYTELLPKQMSRSGDFIWEANDISYLDEARRELSWVQIWRKGMTAAEGDGPYQIEQLIGDRRR